MFKANLQWLKAGTLKLYNAKQIFVKQPRHLLDAEIIARARISRRIINQRGQAMDLEQGQGK